MEVKDTQSDITISLCMIVKNEQTIEACRFPLVQQFAANDRCNCPGWSRNIIPA